MSASILDWQPVLLVKVTRQPLTGACCGLQVSRVHLALHPDGVVCAAWDVPPEQRSFPNIRLVGWKPLRDVPFTPPVCFARQGVPRVSSLIANGTWVLPYDEEQYWLYHRLRQSLDALLLHVDTAPHSPFTLGIMRSLLSTTTYSPSLN